MPRLTHAQFVPESDAVKLTCAAPAALVIVSPWGETEAPTELAVKLREVGDTVRLDEVEPPTFIVTPTVCVPDVEISVIVPL